jgi:hypothetical protein
MSGDERPKGLDNRGFVMFADPAVFLSIPREPRQTCYIHRLTLSSSRMPPQSYRLDPSGRRI